VGALRVAQVDGLTRLAEAARGGDERALEGFVEGAYEQVWRLCALLVDEQSGDDLAQETFARAIRDVPRFRGDSSARTWLLGIARHVCLDELRVRTRRRRRDELVSRSARPESSTADASQLVGTTDLVRRLEPDRRTAFVLTQMLGLSYAETAAVCGCPVGTVRSRVARARAALMGMIEEAAEAGESRPVSARSSEA
jgi:RNA polymerase sigma-70 factor, ECF subfamily